MSLTVNPIWTRGLRSRMRMRHMLSWGVVTMTVTLFVVLMIYLGIIERGELSPADAAKATIPALIVIQSIILMMLGTGSVAAGISAERDAGLLDYVRMTPMRPTTKILGYLFGLPAREYVLFAMTLPLVGIAVAISGFPIGTLLHFYVVFFTSVWVYHMTALVTGTVTTKPRAAQLLSIGFVAVLYLVLPNLSRIGITFFEFLTIRPTFFGLVQQELPPSMQPVVEQSGIDSFRDVPLFGGSVHPTLYTMLVQAFVLGVMFTVLHRRWRNEVSHLLSKVGAFVLFAGVTTFLVGSVWAIVVQEEAYAKTFGFVDRAAAFPTGSLARRPETLEGLLVICAVILGGTYLLAVMMCTASRDEVVQGWRRARKLGLDRLGLNADPASSRWVAYGMLVGILATLGAVMWLAADGGAYFAQGPEFLPTIALVATIVGAGLFVHGFRERFGFRVFGVGLFLIWMVPFFAMMIVLGAFEAVIPGAWIGLPCAPVAVAMGIAQMLESTVPAASIDPQYLPDELRNTSGLAITVVGAAGHLGSGLLLQLAAAVHRRKLKAIGLSGSAPGSGSGSGSGGAAAPAADAVPITGPAEVDPGSGRGPGPGRGTDQGPSVGTVA